MNKKDFWSKLKKTFKNRDSRFWLMIFVVVSTLSLLVLWSLNLKDSFSDKTTLSQDIENLKLEEKEIETEDVLGDFSSLLDTLAEEEEDFSEDLSEEKDLNEVQGIFSEAIIEKQQKEDFSTSSVDLEPGDDLDYSEQEITDLKKQIEELEKKLED